MTRFPRTSPTAAETTESPWRLGGLSLRELAGRVWQEVNNDEVLDRAAALSYYILFALFPLLLFLTTLVGLLPLPDLMGRLMDYTRRVLPGDAGPLVQKTLGEAVRGARGGLLSIGALAALWAGSSGMGSVIAALNVAYGVQDPRPWWRRRAVAIVLTVAFSVLTVIALTLLVFGGKIGDALGGFLGVGGAVALAWNVLQWPVAVFFALLAISLVYYLAPAAEQRWRWVTPGSAFALAAWLVMSSGLRLYVSRFANYNATYGSIGGVILLMLWLYLGGVVLLVGAEINAEIQAAARTRPRGVEPARPRLAAVRAPVSELESDIAIAGRVVEGQIEEIRRRGWTPYMLLAGAGMTGLFLSRRPAAEVAGRSADTVRTGLQVASALAAIERFRARPRARRAA